jgi:hypothetical protein
MQPHGRSRRRGISQIELIVIALAVLLMAALLLPALSTGPHEAAPKSRCQDNLHNLAIAAADYEITFKTFPPGWRQQERFGANWSWGAVMLPFLEQRPLYVHLNIAGPDSLAQALARESAAGRMDQFQLQPSYWSWQCPSDSELPVFNTAMPFVDSLGNRHELAPFSYVGNLGSTWDPLHPDQIRGVFGPDSATLMADITDGGSNTILFGERAWALPRERTWYGREVVAEAPCNAAVLYGVGGDGAQTFWHYTLAVGESGLNNRSLTASGTPACATGLSSLHVGGTQAVMTDSKVIFMSETTDPTVLVRLMDKADGQAVKVP